MAESKLISRSLVWLACCVVSFPAWAGRPVRVYEVDLKGPQSPAALQDAMREALVRATGRRESAADPALANLISDAQNYVKGYSPSARGQSQVIFDGAAVERAIVDAGRNVWDRNRPFTLVVLYPPPARGNEEAIRNEVDQVAISRGLPVTLVPLSPVDASGNDLGRDALLQMAQRYGGDAVLVGKGDATAANTQLQWTLYTGFSTESWSGPLSAGINGAVDTMAPIQGGSLAQTESTAKVEIGGVASLTDYVNVERLLETVPGVRHANVSSAGGTTVVFDVLARGGGDALSRALAGASHLSREDASGPRLVYRYRP
jgi:hypothetical protein